MVEDGLNDVHKEILQVVSDNPGINQKCVCEKVERPKSTVSKRIGFLLENDYITDKKGWKDNATEYHLDDSVSLSLDMSTNPVLDYRVILNIVQVFVGVLLFLNYPEHSIWIVAGLITGLVPNIVYTGIELYKDGDFMKLRVHKSD